MLVIKRSKRKQPRLSLILLDWGVRESFHLLHYLRDQTIPRESFEVVLIEFYDTVSEAARKFDSEIDTWIVLGMPADCYYHKHLMYNAGIVFSQGEILMFGDSDAMVRPVFVETALQAFDRDPLIVYHMDEFRNIRRDFYPFSYPSFQDVLGDGCINNIGGKTKGVLDDIDPIHTRNYGACMCARRKDLIAIGGADEDLTYLGHICGPYDMTFRLMNFGRRLEWETEEFLYHTWHPGSDGVDNYLGPHDGKNMSSTAFHALRSGRIPPMVENPAIRRLRIGSQAGAAVDEVEASLIDSTYAEAFNRVKLGGPVRRPVAPASGPKPVFASYRGLDVYRIDGSYYALPQHLDLETTALLEDERVIGGRSFAEVCDQVDAFESRLMETIDCCRIWAVGKRFAVVPHQLEPVDFRVPSRRENPGIVWTVSLGEAHKAAHQMSTVAALAKPVPAEAPAPVTADLASDLTRATSDITNLERRITAVEVDVSGIYRSRTWRALTSLAGLLQAAANMFRPRKNDSN